MGETVTEAGQVDGAEPDLCGIGSAAAQLGVSIRAMRYYEQVGLLRPSGRTAGGNRLYSRRDLARVQRIRELQDLLGFNLDEIRAVLASEDLIAELRAQSHSASAHGERRRQLLAEALDQHIALLEQVDAKISRLGVFRSEIDKVVGNVRAALTRAT
jgi:DNA-binding transcriptional MerR regulator